MADSRMPWQRHWEVNQLARRSRTTFTRFSWCGTKDYENAWCGSNATSNGVFLENTPHQQFTNWFQPFSAFTPYGKIDGSGADCKTATPVDTTTTR
jgi:hypothetical protein